MNAMVKITKTHWYALGGLANPNLTRKHKRGVWVYYRVVVGVRYE